MMSSCTIRTILGIAAAAIVPAAFSSPSLADVNGTVHCSGQTGFDTISYTSDFYGYQSAINRDETGSCNWTGCDQHLAYDYSVDLIKDVSSGQYRLYSGGRWRRSTRDSPSETWQVIGEGDHVLQHRSPTGASGTWSMPHDRPEFWQVQEEGHAGTWFARNYLEPEVLKVNGTCYMYTQVMILVGDPIDIPGQTAAVQADRIQLHTSADGDNWTRWSTQRGVVVNLPDPTHTMLGYQEVMYIPWDTDARRYWMYLFYFVNGVPGGHVRIRSNNPTTFDWSQREPMYFSLGQLGNQVGYARDPAGVPLFVRISFTDDGTGRAVPALEFSRDGLNWFNGDDGPIKLEGSADNQLNKNCYFLGISTLDGTGELEHVGAMYGAATSNSPVAFDIVYSEVGVGEVTFQLMDTVAPVGSISVNSGSSYTRSTSVGLTVSASDDGSGVDEMRFSNDGTTWNAWEDYAGSKPWSLTPGDGSKSVRVQLKDAAGNVSQTYSDSILLDATPPTSPGTPTDAGAYTTSTLFMFRWTPSADSGSGVSLYEYRVGSTPGAADVQAGSVGASSLQKTIFGSVGRSYFFKIMAVDLAGNSSEWSGNSDGISIVQHAPVNVSFAKTYPDPISVGLPSKSVSAVFDDCFYIADGKTSPGIRIDPIGPSSGLTVGSVVNVGGNLTTGQSGERCIEGTFSFSDTH